MVTARIVRQEHDVGHDREFLPARLDLALRGKESGLRIAHGEPAASIGCHVEHAVEAAERLSEFGMADNADRDAGQRGPRAVGDLAAQDRHALQVNRSLPQPRSGWDSAPA